MPKYEFVTEEMAKELRDTSPAEYLRELRGALMRIAGGECGRLPKFVKNELSQYAEEIEIVLNEKASHEKKLSASGYDKRHGGPWDRGSADSYYRRKRSPHYYVGGTGNSPMITESEMTEEQIEAYHAGYDHNEAEGNHKDY